MQDMSRWRTLKSEMALTHPALSVEKALRQSETSGRSHQFVVLHAPDWVNVIPLTGDGQVVLIQQWRHGSSDYSLEIPGGIIDPGESPAEAGARELREETGYRAGEMVHLGWVNPNPALFGNRCHTFVAQNCLPDGPLRLEDTEEIQVQLYPVDQLPHLVRSGRIVHSLVISAFSYFWLGQAAHAGESKQNG